MNIGIDGNEANIKDRVGVNMYAFEILRELKKENEKRPNPSSLIVYLKNSPLPDLPEESKYFSYRVIKGGGLWVITKLTPYLFKNPDKVEVLFSPSHYVPPILNLPRVCSIMDLGYLEFTGQFEKKVLWQLKYWSAISILVSKQVLTISEASKKDIVRHYPFASKKVKVTYLGYDKDKFKLVIPEKDVRQIKNKYSIVDDYILFVGTLKPSKNVEGLIDAYSLLVKSADIKIQLPQLVICGKKGWMYESIFKQVEELKLSERVIFTDYIKEQEKILLMKGAKMFVLPSFWEGFGLDVLSAFSCGIPAVVSSVGSLPEVAGNAGVLVDPYDVKSIAKGIEKVLKMDNKEYNKTVHLGFDQLEKFSWGECAKETLEVLENIKR